MKLLTATRIHNGLKWLPEGSAIETDDEGTITAIHATAPAGALFYEGILCPGFVNVHCHLELSHMKGVIPEHTRLIPFLETIPLNRHNFTDEQKTAARRDAYKELLQNGIVAIGDIANTSDTLDLRAADQLHFYTFVESIGFSAANAERSFNYALQIYNAFAAQEQQTKRLNQTIVPHAPYSVSSALFNLIDGHLPAAPISIHNQESLEENRFYLAKEGDIRNLLKTLGIDDSEFIPTSKTSLQSYLEWLSDTHPFIFVHNTHSSQQDVQFVKQRIKEHYWCLCPNANLYIENTLPDIDMLIGEEACICIGTDSLASNHRLSILAELQTIKQHYPRLSWEMLLSWGTRNGARALQMQDIAGTIETGKQPGILQITGLEDTLEVKRII